MKKTIIALMIIMIVSQSVLFGQVEKLKNK